MKSLNLYCPINTTGYGIASNNIALSLSRIGADVALHVIGQGVLTGNQSETQAIIQMLTRARRYDDNAPCLKIWHQHDLAARVGKGEYYAYPFFEMDRFYDFEKHVMKAADAFFVASKWAKGIIEESGTTKPVFVAPLGVDRKVFNPDIRTKQESKDYVFLHIGKWEKRKGQDVLIEAFNNAFSPKDNVQLWLVPHNPFLDDNETSRWIELVDESPMKEKIKIFPRLPSNADVADLMFNADCGIFLSRAEGWNMEVTEMMSMGRPIIATNYSAHTEFLTNKNSFLVDVDETEPAYDGKWFHGHGHWAKFGDSQMSQTVEHMRFVYSNKVNSNPHGLETAKLLSWENTASIIHQTLIERNSYNANS